MSYSPEQVEAMADNLVGYMNTPAAPMLRAYAATLRQQAARVDAWQYRQRTEEGWGEWQNIAAEHVETVRRRADCEVRGLAALEAALSARPAERQGEAKPVATVIGWTNGSYHRNYKIEWHQRVETGDKLYLRPAAPVGVPDGAVDTRDHFGPPCVAVVFDTQENANKYRDKLTEAMQLRQNIAAAPSAPQGEG